MNFWYIWWWNDISATACCPFQFAEVVTEISRTFHCVFWWASQICQLPIISRFSTLLGPRCHMNAATPSLHLSLSLYPVPPFFPHWHNDENDAKVPPHQTLMKEWEKERVTRTDAERDTELQCGSKFDCASKLNRGEKNVLLNWLYVHEKKNHNPSLRLSLSVSSVSWCQLSTCYQCLLLHSAIKASFEWLNAAFHIVLHILLCPEELLFDIQTTYPKATVIVTLCIEMGQLAVTKGLIL